jgi:hypothetical protein
MSENEEVTLYWVGYKNKMRYFLARTQEEAIILGYEDFFVTDNIEKEAGEQMWAAPVDGLPSKED